MTSTAFDAAHAAATALAASAGYAFTFGRTRGGTLALPHIAGVGLDMKACVNAEGQIGMGYASSVPGFTEGAAAPQQVLYEHVRENLAVYSAVLAAHDAA